jgi:hypothetical protein
MGEAPGLRSSRSGPRQEAAARVACVTCGAPVDTREIADGGGPDGAELDDGVWACSHECWHTAADRSEPASHPKGEGAEE